MDAYPHRYEATPALRRQHSTRRTLQVLEVKRERIRDELQQLVSHMGLRVPPRVLEIKRQRIREELEQLVRHMRLIVPPTDTEGDLSSEILQDALDLLGDETFAKCVRQILQEQ